MFFSGNEPFINEIVSKLIKFFRSQSYLSDNLEVNLQHEDKLRSITFYMILNTDVSIKYDLSKDQKISHLLNTMPQLTECVLVNVIWGTKLNRYFFEFMSYAPSYYVVQFLEKSIESLRVAEPYDVLDRVEQLSKSIYLNICRLDYNVDSRNNSAVDKKIILNKFHDSFLNLIRNFNTPDADKFTNWSSQNKMKYYGYLMKHLFSIINFCFDLYKTRPKLEIAKEFHIYLLMNDFEILFDNHNSMYTDTIDGFLLEINNSWLNSLQNNVMSITLNTFLDWVEFDLEVALPDGEKVQQTLQQVVGEMAYKLTEIINTNECFKHDVLQQLQSISIKPKTEQELVSASTVGEIMIKLDNLAKYNLEKRCIWLNGLLKYDSIFGNLECLNTIYNNIDLIKNDEIKILILNQKMLTDDQCSEEFDNEELDKLNEIILKSIQENLNSEELIEIILYIIRISGENYQKYRTEENIRSLNNQFLNRMTVEDIDTNREINCLHLIVNSPKLFYEDLFHHLCNLNASRNAQHFNNIAIHIIKTSKAIFSFYIKGILNDIVTKDDVEIEFFDNFLTSLYELEVIDKTEFVKECYYKHILYTLRQKKYSKLLMLIKSINSIACNMPESLRPPILVAYGSILDEVRWSMETFSNIRLSIVEITITSINNLMRRFLLNSTPEDKRWVHSNVDRMQLITKYYFHRLLLAPKDNITKFDEFMLEGTEFTSERGWIFFISTVRFQISM